MIAQPTKLPSRKVLKELGTSKMTLNDYAKVTPVKPDQPLAPLFQVLRAEQIRRR